MTYPAPFPRLCSYSWWVTAGPQSRLRLFGLVRGQQALVRDRRYLLVTCQLRVVDPAKALLRCVLQAEQVIQRLLTVSDNSTNHPTEEPLSLAGFQPRLLSRKTIVAAAF